MRQHPPTIEEIFKVMGSGTMETREIADAFGAVAYRSVYEALCGAKCMGWVEIVWLSKYRPAWRRKA